MKYSLQDLIDMEHFQNLQDRLNEIYSFPSSIIDNDGNILTATAWQDICTQFHRKHKECEKECVKSDQYILSRLHEANPAVSYQCPHGLVDNATPIIIDGIHYGNFFTGQFFLEKPNLEFFKAQAQKYGFDQDSYLAAVKKVPIWTQEQLNSYLYFIKGLIVIITESGLKNLREAEVRKKIEESEQKFRGLFNNSTDAIFIHDMDGHFLEVNEVACKNLGFTRDEFLRMTPLDIDASESAIQGSAPKEVALYPDHQLFQTVHRRKDGTEIPVEINSRGIEWTGKPCILSVARDITERKQAEAALKESEQHYRNLFDQANEGLLIMAFDGKLHEVNKAFADMHGYTIDELKRMNISDLDIFKERTPEERSETISRWNAGEVVRFEVEHYHKDGHILCFTVTASLIELGGKSYQLAFHQDITKRKQMETRLLQTQRMESIGMLAGGIAHDFNNLLFPIIGLSELLLADLPNGSPENENAEEIFKAAKRAGDLVKQILSFSRQSDQQKTPVRIQHILKEVIKLSRATIPSNIEINTDIQNNCGLVMADPSQIHQVAMNLITNAYHAVEEKGGSITVRLKEESWVSDDFVRKPLLPGKHAILTVSDTGCGIAPSVINRIFEPYFSTKPQGKGTGLGLSVVFGIVKDHGGDIQVSSEPGKGTTFIVNLPLMKKNLEVAQPEVSGVLETGDERILLVDDEASIVRLETQILERLGYEVTTRTSSIDALAAFRANPDRFDLVITDMTMPNMTGDRLAGELLSTKPNVPIIICTGFSEKLSEEKASAIGIKGYLMKPVVRSDMAKMVRKVLDETKG